MGVADGYQQLSVGDPRIDARKLKPYAGQWRVVEKRLDGSQVEVERSSEKVDRVRNKGRRVWRQIQHETFGNTGTSDMTVLTDASSFAPLLAEQKDVRDGSLKRISYHGREIGIECGGHLCPPTIKAPAQGTIRHAVRTDAAPFDYFGGSYGILFAVLPLKVGARFRVPVYSPAQGLIWLRVEVTGTERVNAGGGRMVEAFRVVTPQNGWVYHVSKKPPYWLRLEYRMPSGVIQITERV